jgi:quinohemoprotein ethanol dehydrogenase
MSTRQPRTRSASRRAAWRVAVLALAACHAAVAAAPSATGESDEWRYQGRDADGTFYSPLSAINAGNVGRLGFAWDYDLGTRRGQESTPLVIDGRMYVTSNFGRVYALDAASGHELWTYDPTIEGSWARYPCCDAVNRGVAAFEGRVYVGALDGWLHALDADTGRLLWKVDTLIGRDEHKPYTITGAPLLAGDLVVIGNGGADFAGVRGYVSAYDRTSGALRWRLFTVPRNPAEGPQDQPHLEAALKTWDPRHPWERGAGGGTAWDGMAFDATLNLIYIGTGNAAPYNMHLGGRHGGDELYAASIVAIHADSGSFAWAYQTTPGDRWDFDSTQKLILADIPLEGKRHRVLMQAAKNGYYYVLDAASGALLSAHNFAFVNWTRGLDARGRPLPDARADYDAHPALVFPSEAGAHSWEPMAYDPGRAVTYLPVIEAGNVILETSTRRAGLVEGQFTTPAIPVELYDPKEMRSLYGVVPPLQDLARGLKTRTESRGYLRAWSVPQHRILWEVPSVASLGVIGGVLATGGGLVFQGDPNGHFNAYDADTGARKLTLDLGTSMIAAPITYRVNGEQYIAIVAGYGGGGVIQGAPLDPATAAYRYGNEGRVIALRLDGKTPPLPPPRTDAPLPELPPRPTDAKAIAHGELLYNRFCARCHVFGRGNLPDLRRLQLGTHALFDSIVLQGLYAPKGMGRFSDVLTPADAAAVHAYLIDQAWQLEAGPVPAGR